MRSVYIETTIASYLVAWPSRDVVILAWQELTREWWEKRPSDYRYVVSQVVLGEARGGDPVAAARRMEWLDPFDVLAPCGEIEALAVSIKAALALPESKVLDAFHLAYAVHYRVDYLLTWNFAHFANVETERALADYTRAENLWLPIICTPENMLTEREPA